MKQRDPQRRPPSLALKEDQDLVRQVRHYKVITPLFGGGAIPQQPDEVTVIRASEIRGLLRFWWRATRGGQFNGSLDAMRKAEEAIWGSAAGGQKTGPSQATLHVTVTSKGQPFQATDRKGKPVKSIGDIKSIYSYIAFPLRDIQGAKVWRDVEFKLEVRFPERYRQDVEAALWAWETFGGIGARTRRGFGALQLTGLEENGQSIDVDTPSCHGVKAWIERHLNHYLAGEQWPESVPHLRNNLDFHVRRPSKNALDAWSDLIQRYQAFRQRRHRRYGLSLWPEANVIRQRMGHPIKRPPNITNYELVEAFPRGQFGLPIIFHMPHDKKALKQEDFTLQGSSPAPGKPPIDRLASPLILRPLACQKGFVGLAVVLEAPRTPPYGLEVPEFPEGHRSVRANLTKKDANTEPLRRILHGEPDVLKAFLNFLKAQS